jgi:hypothetical protein
MKNEVLTIRAVEEFKNAWLKGMENLLAACKIYVEAIDADETAKEKFREAMPKVSGAMWSRIEKVGRGQVHYMLLCDTSHAACKISKLPYSEQKEVIECGVEVLTTDGTTLKVRPENLTPAMSSQVIAKDHVRDIAEQKAYLESMKTIADTESKKMTDMWQVKGKMLHVLAPTAFTRQQLVNILQDIG